MNKKLHLISNAHIDPVWQWEWEEGAATAISTFRCAAAFCREFDGYIFCHNEALLYQWVEEYEPALFEEIRALVKEGKWHIMGGWHLQPDCNMPSGESFVRQILSGREYFKMKFGVELPTTAINFDPFGHTRGLVQILAKSGYDSYLFCRPGQGDCPLPAEDFTWVGYDGSKVLGRRSPGYGTGLGHATDKIRGSLAGVTDENPIGFCLWGVGNHGGGPSRKDLRDIAALMKEAKENGVEIIHSTPENYFADIRSSGRKLPEFRGSLNSWAPGCYTSQIRIKQKHREVEGMLYSCEKMCTELSLHDPSFVYPEKEIGEALYDLLTAEFHDSLPGSSIQPVEEMALRMLDHGKEILTRVRMRAFLRLAEGQKTAAEGEIPVLVYNPHPYPVEGDFTCEFMLADQNWSESWTIPSVYRDGVHVPSQCEKEDSNLPLDWRKRVVFHATLAPSSMNRFDCRMTILPKKPVLETGSDPDTYVFDSPYLHAAVNKKTGLLDALASGGVSYLKPGALSIDVMKDTVDPWSQVQQQWREKIGSFTLLSEEEGTDFSNVDAPIPSVRMVEDGEVRTVIEAVFGYRSSRAVVRYLFSKTAPVMDVQLRIVNCEKSKMFKLRVPQALTGASPLLEVSYGEEEMRMQGFECPGQRYVKVKGSEGSFAILNGGTYGSSFDGGDLYLTLLRSPGYTAHPIGDRKIMPQDRHSPYVDQGERLYSFRFLLGDPANVARAALSMNEAPMAVSFFPSGSGDEAMAEPNVFLEGEEVIMTALKKASDGNGWIVRLFHPAAESGSAVLTVPALGTKTALTFGAYEVRTLRLTDGTVTECDLMEQKK